MPTDTLISLPSIASSHALATDLRPAIGADEDQKLQGDVYDGSSSLSEIEDRAGTEHPSHGCSDANDTEAETERLEDSPQKQRTHQNLLLTATTSIHDHHQSPSTTHALSTRVRRHGQPNASNDSVGLADALLALDSVGDRLEQNSDISFLEASGEEHGQAVSPTPSSPMKRKRSSFGNDSASDQEIPQEPSVKAMKFLRGTSARDLPSLDAKTSPDALLEQDDQELFAGIARLPISQNESRKAELPSKQKHMKGKRKVKKIPDDEPTDAVNVGSAVQSPVQRNADTVHSNEDDAQIEGVVDGPEADNPVKTEERKWPYSTI